MNKDELIGNIKHWIGLDEEIKNLQRRIKEKRKEKVSCPFCSNILTRGCLIRHKKYSCKNKPE